MRGCIGTWVRNSLTFETQAYSVQVTATGNISLVKPAHASISGHR